MTYNNENLWTNSNDSKSPDTFSITSARYDAMKTSFNAIADKISSAVKNDVPIIIRHHNDPDGMSSGITLELAIKKLMIQHNVKWFYNLTRLTCKTPFYDITDFWKDLSVIKKHQEMRNTKPLVIIADNGSTPEDTLALEALHATGVEIIVIDHHDPVSMTKKNGLSDGRVFESTNCQFLAHHLNPHLFELDNSLSAGMLCYEVSQKIYSYADYKAIPAIAGLDDRMDCDEVEQYIARSGLSTEELLVLGEVLDYAQYTCKFDLSTDVFLEILNNKKLVLVLKKEIALQTKQKMATIMPQVKEISTQGAVKLFTVALLDYTEKYSYPRIGKVADLVKDALEEQYGSVILLSYLDSAVIVRQTKAKIGVPEAVKRLREALPLAGVNGGGHDCAGSIGFLAGYEKEAKAKLEELFSA